jgi:hypothetical protein
LLVVCETGAVDRVKAVLVAPPPDANVLPVSPCDSAVVPGLAPPAALVDAVDSAPWIVVAAVVLPVVVPPPPALRVCRVDCVIQRTLCHDSGAECQLLDSW